MLENLDKIQGVANGIDIQPVESTINEFSNILNGFETYINDPAIFDLIHQIYSLLEQLSSLSN